MLFQRVKSIRIVANFTANTKRSRHVLQSTFFDFDGTLVNSVRTFHEAFCATCIDFGNPGLSFEEYLEEHHPPYRNHWNQAGFEISLHETLEKQFFAYVDSYRSEIHLFEKTPQTIKELYQLGVRLGIISANSKENILAALSPHNLTPYFEFIAPDCSPKVACIEQMCRELGLPKERAGYVGDGKRDMEDAKEAGVTAIGITGDTLGVKQRLRKAGADFCVEHLGEIPQLLERVARLKKIRA